MVKHKETQLMYKRAILFGQEIGIKSASITENHSSWPTVFPLGIANHGLLSRTRIEMNQYRYK